MSARPIFLTTLLSTVLFGQATLSRYINAPGGEALVTIRAAERSTYRVPRTICGTFLEHIGNSVWGGVSAQLLDNPSLEPYPANLETLNARFSEPSFKQSSRFNLPLPWIPLRASGRRYEPRSDHPINSTTCLYVMGLRGREVGIRQAIFLPIEREPEYQGVLYARADERPVSINVSIRRRNRPDEVLAQSTMTVSEPGRWTRLPFRLRLPEGSVKPLETVDFAVAVNDGGRASFDEIRLYPADAAGGLDPEIVRLAKELHSPLLRYGGNFSSGYHWQDGIGPVESRPTRINEAWGIPEYNEFGTDEFMDLCRRIGALPQICLNLGSGDVQEARDWIEYCQGPADSTQGRRRAANGHAQPYEVGAWEFGNELYDDTQLGWFTPDSYAARYVEFFRALEPLVPAGTRLLATGGELGAFTSWNGALLRRAGKDLQFITTHLVADLETTVGHLDHDGVMAAALALPVGVGRALPQIRAQMEADRASAGRIKLAYTEWMFRSPASSSLPSFDNMGGAVIAAAWLNMLILRADWIPIANMTGLLEFGGIHKARGRTYVSPQYWSLYLYSRYAGDTVVGTETRAEQYDVHRGQPFAPEISDVPFLDVLATADSATGALRLFIVNRNPKDPEPVTVKLDAFRASPEVKIVTLSAASLLDRNDEAQPDRVRPVESRADMAGGALRHVLQPGSVTVMFFAPAK